MGIYNVKTENGYIKANVTPIEDWDGFDILIKYLEKQFNAIVTDKLDGPESRVYKLAIADFIFELHNNPYGNYFKTKEKNKAQLLKILNDIEKRLNC